MSSSFDNINKSILPKQNRYLPIVLWLFPLLLINIGWYVFTYIDFRWIESEWVEQSKQEAELLAASSDFSYCMGNLAGSFFDDLKSGVESFPDEYQKNSFIKYLTSRAEYKFRKPFPDYSLMIFKMPLKTKKAELMFTNVANLTGKRALSISFEYLVRTNLLEKDYTGADEKAGSSITKTFLGGECEPSVVAETQRGKVSYSLYKFKSHYFLWDYFENEKTGAIYGFFILTENNKNADICAKLVALRNIRNSQNNNENQVYGAFIPLFAGYGGIVASEEFSKIPEYKDITHKWIPKNLNDLYNWQFNTNTTKLENTRFGKYQVFLHLGAGHSHAALLVKPLLHKPSIPFWLFLLNVISIIIIFILLVRGFLFGRWPQTSLKIRFVTTYFLAACMPLGLLIIAAYGYISEFKHSTIFNYQSELRSCISQFDSRKTQNQDDYKTAYMEVINDPIFKDYLKKYHDNINDKTDAFPEDAKNILNRAIEIINRNSRYLPLMNFTVLDELGNYFSNFGNTQFQYFKRMKGKEYSCLSQEETAELKRFKNLSDTSVEILLFSFLQPLRRKINELAPGDAKWTEEYVPSILQETARGGFKTATGGAANMAEELDKHRSFSLSRLVGDRIISHIYDYLFVDGVPRFAMYIGWDVSSLDDKSFESTLRYFDLKKPEFVFSAFQVTPQRIKPWKNSGRHGREFEKISLTLANQANFRKTYVTSLDDDLLVIAVPSLKYKNTIIVGGVSQKIMLMPIFKRIIICLIIVILALLTFIISIYYSSIIFIKPIGNLKKALDKVAEGDLDIEIKSHSKDEFGTMCHEFSLMTKELSERDKLATLISDHAVEALSKNEEGNSNISDVETFKGTALVTDIRNFTGMCEKYNPEQITDLLNEHFARMTRIFSLNGGRIYKYIGDAVEVVFADNDDNERSSVERAFIAAIEMLDCLEHINTKRKNADLFEYRIGVGLCYSSMSSGSIGSLETRLDYAILGNALKNAAKLEAFSKLNPEFPLIVDDNFISELKKQNVNLNFSLIKSEEGLNGYKVEKDGLEDFLNSRNIEITQINDSSFANKKEEKDNKKNAVVTESYDIEEYFSFWRVFIPGSMFIIILVFLIFIGFYYTHKTEIETKKTELASNNQRVFEQMSCDAYGKTAFDIKCRFFAKSLQDRFNELDFNEINDSEITEALNKCYRSDKTLEALGLNTVFVRVDDRDYKSLFQNAEELSFIGNLPLKGIANTGYTDDEIKKICDTYRICLVLNNLGKNKIDDYSFKKHLQKNYGEPCRDIFGEKIIISLLNNDLKNTSTEAVFRNNDALLFTLDYYKKVDSEDKLIGYLVMTMPLKTAYNSIPFLISCYSKNGENIYIRDNKYNKWYFSQNVPSYISDKINKLSLENNVSNDAESTPEIAYLKSLSDNIISGLLKFDETSCDVFLIDLYKNSNNLPLNNYLIIVFITSFLFYCLYKIANKTSSINYSIASKLWLTLLIVAVIPVITVFFVSSLFINEFLFVKKSQQRSEMQRFTESYERKMEFLTPLLWNYIRTKNNSNEFKQKIHILNDLSLPEKIRKEEGLAKTRQMVKSWIEALSYSGDFSKLSKEEKDLVSFTISDVSISGKNKWSFGYTDEEDSLEIKKLDLSSVKDVDKDFEESSKDAKKDKSNEIENTSSDDILPAVSYLNESIENSTISFGLLLKLCARSLLNRRDSGDSLKKIDNSKIANDVAVEAGLGTVKAFFGDDTFVKMSHGINVPVIFNIGFGKFGLMINTVPDYKNPEAIIVWAIAFDTFDYMRQISRKIKTEYTVYTSENFRYGIVAKDTNDNNKRIPIGEFAAWISTSNLPVSTSLNYGNVNYFIEGGPSITQINALLLFSCSESSIIKNINKINAVFYILLAISLSIIIITTKNIADDIINPINTLITGIKEVDRENFSFRINSDRTDELGALCLSFDMMIKGLDEKRLMSRMLSNTARMITLNEGNVSSGKTDAVLLYIGIPAFSEIMKNLTDYEVFTKLKKHTAVIAGSIMAEGGEVDKIIGEKMLAYFRVSNNEGDVSLAAYRVAKRILDLEKTNSLAFPIAIGLNYGNVINGFLGVGNKRDFTIIGDPVNVTARIESLAEKLESNRCLISDTFYKLVDKSVTAQAYGEVELKGKSQPMKVYQLS